MGESYTVLLVDDHQIVLDGIKTMLRKQKQFTIVNELNDAHQAIEYLSKNNEPDFIITDITMPGMSGIELTAYLKKHHPEIKVLVLTIHDDFNHINKIIQAEAEGYLLKTTTQKELINALNSIAEGATYYGNEVVQILMSHQPVNKKTVPVTYSLTKRELDVLKLICDEKTTKEIALELSISSRTVEVHRQHISQKMGVKNIVGLIKRAIADQLVKTE